MFPLRKADLETLLKEKNLLVSDSQFSSRPQEKLGTLWPPLNDFLSGGFPRGQISEIIGPLSSGKSSLLLSLLAEATRLGEVVACVDHDQFDPWSAYCNGVDLKKLLWVRCAKSFQLLKAADILCHAGNFGVIALDMASLQRARVAGLDVWFRLQRAVEGTRTVLLVMSLHPLARTAARLTVSLEKKDIHWDGKQSTWKLLQGFSIEACCIRGKQGVARMPVKQQFRRSA